MGKRQRRRQREQTKRRKQQRAVVRYLFPNAERPLLEVHFEDGTSGGDKELCLAYWAFTEPGTWTSKVADIGSSALVSRTVKAASHACLLTVLCPQCTSPLVVRSRSDLAAMRVWRSDLFPREERNAKIPCETCHEVAAEARRKTEQREAEAQHQAKKRAEEQQRKAVEAKVANAGAWIAGHRDRPFPDEPPSVRDSFTLLTMIDIMEQKDAESFGPLDALDYEIGASRNADLESLKNLHAKSWITPTLPATIGDFAFDENNNVEGVYLAAVPWRLAHALGGQVKQARKFTVDTLWRILLETPGELDELTQEMDRLTAVLYLDSLLVRKYDEGPIPEHRLQEAHDAFEKSLRTGYTLGQLITVAWGATGNAVAWGQRTPGLKPGSVSSAAVTTLSRRLAHASDRVVPEYDVPRWVTPPAMRSTLHRFLDQHQDERKTLSRFRALQQRIGIGEAFEIDSDLADASESEEASVNNSPVPEDEAFDPMTPSPTPWPHRMALSHSTQRAP